MALIALHSLNDTKAVANALAESMLDLGIIPVFLRGDLGAGKTTFAKFFVESLEGAENAEISSPSFNIINYYPTNPAVLHCDLYRCKEDLPAELEEAIHFGGQFILVEWSNFLTAPVIPDNFLDIQFMVINARHSMEISAAGEKAQRILEMSLNRFTNRK